MDRLIVVGIRRACVLDPRSMQLSACQTCWRRKRSRQNDIESRSKASTVSFILCNAFIVLLQCIGTSTWWYLYLLLGIVYPRSNSSQNDNYCSLMLLWRKGLSLWTSDSRLLHLACLSYCWSVCIFNQRLYFQHPTSFEQCSIFAATALSFCFEGFGWMHGTTGCIQCFLRASAPSCFMAKAQDLEHGG